MAATVFQGPHNEEPLAPPPLGPELTSGKWRVRVIDDDEKITQEMISGKQVWSMLNRRVMVDFNHRGQPIKDSGGLFGTWIGSLSNDLNILPIDYTDWRLVSTYRKDMAWKVIQKKFWFDHPNKRKKYVLSALGARCRNLKQRIWDQYRRNTLEESIKERPTLIPEDQWIRFVHIQFTDKAKKTRMRNIQNRSKLNVLHTLGKKSLARKAYEILEDTGTEPSRAELFIASRTRSDGSFVCNEAQICADKLTHVMNQNIRNEAPTNKHGSRDVFEQVFGPEHSGRVRCVGHGLTPSKYFNSLESQTSSPTEMVEIKSFVKRLEDKFDIIASAFQTLILKNQLQGSTEFNNLFHQTSSNTSDQTSTMTNNAN